MDDSTSTKTFLVGCGPLLHWTPLWRYNVHDMRTLWRNNSVRIYEAVILLTLRLSTATAVKVVIFCWCHYGCV